MAPNTKNSPTSEIDRATKERLINQLGNLKASLGSIVNTISSIKNTDKKYVAAQLERVHQEAGNILFEFIAPDGQEKP